MLPCHVTYPTCLRARSRTLTQIFDFLDVDGLGSIDLVAIMGEAHEWLDDLDDEVCSLGRGGRGFKRH